MMRTSTWEGIMQISKARQNPSAPHLLATLLVAGTCIGSVGAAEKLPIPPTPQADPKAAVFEVASVKPNTSGSGSMSMGWQPGGGFRAVNSPLRSDRKSTRLNSSHLVISYAVFCLKKK